MSSQPKFFNIKISIQLSNLYIFLQAHDNISKRQFQAIPPTVSY